MRLYLMLLEPKEQELRQYFQKWSQTQGLQFVGQSFENLLIKSGFQFSEIQKNLLYSPISQMADRGEGYCRGYSKDPAGQYFDLTQLILGKRSTRRVTWLET